MSDLFRTLHEDETTSAANNVFSAVRDFKPAMQDDRSPVVYAVDETALPLERLLFKAGDRVKPLWMQTADSRQSSFRRCFGQHRSPGGSVGLNTAWM